jgi:hypothetical protein
VVPIRSSCGAYQVESIGFLLDTYYGCERERSSLKSCHVGNGLLTDKTKVRFFYDLRNDSNDDYPDVYFVAKQEWRLPGEIRQER